MIGTCDWCGDTAYLEERQHKGTDLKLCSSCLDDFEFFDKEELEQPAPRPYVDKNDNLVGIFEADEKYHYWKKADPIACLTMILEELGRMDLFDKIVLIPSKGNKNESL